MDLVFGHDKTVVEWASRKLKAPYKLCIGIGVIDDDGALKGAVLLEHINNHTYEGTMFMDCLLMPHLAKRLFEYIFITLRASRLQIHTERKNKAVLKVAPMAGFKWDGVSKNYYGQGRDALRFYLTPENCRWVKNYGISPQPSTAERSTRRRSGAKINQSPDDCGRSSIQSL